LILQSFRQGGGHGLGLSLVNPFRRDVVAILVQRYLGRFSLRIGIEGQLSVHHFQEKLSLAFGEFTGASAVP
jgi:hypothetical protein